MTKYKSNSLAYEISDNDTFWLVVLNQPIHSEASQAFAGEIEEKFAKAVRPVVIDCGVLREISSSWLRVMVQLNQKMKSISQPLRLVGSPALAKLLYEEGLGGSIKLSKSVQGALEELSLGPKAVPQKAAPSGVIGSFDVNFVNPFLSATIKTLETQANTSVKPGSVFTKNAREKFSGDISGIIGIVADKFKGSVVISFPASTFLNIMSRMLGEECKELTSEIEDGAGELTNIIFGQAKQELNDRGYGIQMAMPSVVTGQDHSVQNLTNGPRVAIPFTTDAGAFVIEICISEQ